MLPPLAVDSKGVGRTVSWEGGEEGRDIAPSLIVKKRFSEALLLMTGRQCVLLFVLGGPRVPDRERMS